MRALSGSVFVTLQGVFAAQPVDVVRVGVRVDVEVAVFGADGAVAVVGGGVC